MNKEGPKNSFKVLIDGKIIITEPGVLISKLMGHDNHTINMPCAGKGKCGKCKVKVVGDVSPICQHEKNLLSREEIESNTRLACSTYLKGSATIELVEEAAITQVLVHANTVFNINEPMFNNYGVAIDIGTTTLAAVLFDKNKLIATLCRNNPQSKMGADVISRIELALNGEVDKLRSVIVDAVNSLLVDLSHQSKISVTDINSVVITGNTTMLYLLTGKDCEKLSHAPFEAEYVFGEYLEGKQIGISMAEGGSIYLPRCISAFVGADITTAIIASGMLKTSKTAILVDIGTNGEMALWHNEKLTCCSTAAGPAFEGAEIHNGVSGIAGAIDKVFVENEHIGFTTIGNIAPVGICGSGIVDAVSTMKEIGAVSEMGTLIEEELEKMNLFARYQNNPAMKICDDIIITQIDIRKVQLAKSAICAGIKTLIEVCDINYNDISTLYLAGGFGNYINLNNAANIGLIPQELVDKTKVIGNASLSGAAYLLCNKNNIDIVQSIATKANSFDLGSSKIFMDNYIDCMEI